MQVHHGGSPSVRVWDQFFGLIFTLVVTCLSYSIKNTKNAYSLQSSIQRFLNNQPVRRRDFYASRSVIRFRSNRQYKEVAQISVISLKFAKRPLGDQREAEKIERKFGKFEGAGGTLRDFLTDG